MRRVSVSVANQTISFSIYVVFNERPSRDFTGGAEPSPYPLLVTLSTSPSVRWELGMNLGAERRKGRAEAGGPGKVSRWRRVFSEELSNGEAVSAMQIGFLPLPTLALGGNSKNRRGQMTKFCLFYHKEHCSAESFGSAPYFPGGRSESVSKHSPGIRVHGDSSREPLKM
ncbi:hypothetical protein EVAR_54403_1 [Eumeta japonica]|uniref:Uncharacterized protein n=1 Tax=Eumeta variegata TaxID=151549 RepID=A0A4C1Y639_EUMVA|nr:hypothetical protein EVAR_54403_1 [Eumeta japonica]